MEKRLHPDLREMFSLMPDMPSIERETLPATRIFLNEMMELVSLYWQGIEKVLR